MHGQRAHAALDWTFGQGFFSKDHTKRTPSCWSMILLGGDRKCKQSGKKEGLIGLAPCIILEVYVSIEFSICFSPQPLVLPIPPQTWKLPTLAWRYPSQRLICIDQWTVYSASYMGSINILTQTGSPFACFFKLEQKNQADFPNQTEPNTGYSICHTDALSITHKLNVLHVINMDGQNCSVWAP